MLRAAAVTPQLPPPADLTEAGPEHLPAGGIDVPRPAGRWWRRPLVLTAAAVAAMVIAGGVIWVTRPAGPTPEQAAAQCVAAATDAQVRRPSVGSGGSVTMARSCDAAVVRVAAMPELPSDRTYQLWVMAGSAARSVALVTPQGNGAGQIVITGIAPSDTDIGVSVEPAGGSATPTTTPIWVVPIGG